MKLDPNELPKRDNSEKLQVTKNDTKNAIRKGLSMLLFSAFRIFVEALIVQLIWNNVVVEHGFVSEVSYWHSLLLLLLVRILLGQIKITFRKQ